MQWHFGPFRLDLVNACLWHAAQPVPVLLKNSADSTHLK
jgi:hypothetical protein